MRGPSFLLGVLLSLGIGASPAVEAGSYCHAKFASLVEFEYPKKIAQLYPGVPHTIQDLEKFLKDKLGIEVIESIKGKSARYIVVSGPARSPFDYFKRDTILSYREIHNPFGAFNTLEVKLRDGSISYVFTNINGSSRETQIFSLLKLAGASSDRVQHLGRSSRYHSLYRRTFKKIGHRPDLVVFGFANTAVEGLLEGGAKRNLETMIRKNKDYSKNKWIKPRFDEHELWKMGVQVLEFESGKKVWLIDNEYGDRAAWLMDSLHEIGSRRTVFLGTAGSLNSEYKIGDILTPQRLVGLTQDTNSPKIRGKIPPRGSHGDVDSPSLETKDWLNEQIQAGVDYVDVELQKVVPRVAKDSEFSAYLVISDEINSPTIKDYTHWGEAERQGVKIKITSILRKHLEEVGIKPEDKPVTLQVHLFDVAGEG